MVSDASTAWSLTLREVAVIGAGTMGEGIAQVFAQAGLAVRLIDIEGAALERCQAQIGANLRLAAACGLAGEPADDVLCRITPVLSDRPEREIEGAGLVIETIPEILALKQELLRRLDGLDPDVMIGSNTSSLTITAMCEGMATGHRVVGLHYFNPAHIIPAVEIHGGQATSPQTLARARAVHDRVGKVAFVLRKTLPGLVINRLTGALMREIYHLLEEDVISPEDLDAGVKASLGFRMARMGPMESADFTGLDVGKRVVTALLPQLSTRSEPPALLLDKVAAGDLGIKTGRGWLDYHGRTRAELLDDRNTRLLAQLKSFQLMLQEGS